MEGAGSRYWHAGETWKMSGKRLRLSQYSNLGCSMWFRAMSRQWPGRFLDIISEDPSVSKQCPGRFLGRASRHPSVLQVQPVMCWHCFGFFFTELGYILQIPLNLLVIFLTSWTSTGYFSTSAGSSVTSSRSPRSLFPSSTSYMLTLFGSSGIRIDVIENYALDSSKTIDNFPEVSNFNWLFLKLDRFICN
jgi:hypothetical protein